MTTLEPLNPGILEPFSGIRLELELDDSLPLVLLDPEGVGNALQILIENAVEAMAEQCRQAAPRPAVLTIKTSLVPSGPTAKDAKDARQGAGEEGRVVRIEVSDTGKGIPDGYVEKALEPFFTLDKPHGSGLGLTFARTIVEDYGGAIELSSRQNKGTRVRIELPVRS